MVRYWAVMLGYAVSGQASLSGRVCTPDLMLAVPRRGFHGLFIEMKRTKGGTISDEQNQFLHELRLAGYNAVCCRGSDEAIRAISVYLS